MEKIRALSVWFGSALRAGRLAVAAAFGVVLSVGLATVAGATVTTVLTTGTTTMKTSLISDLGFIVPAILAIAVIGIGVRLLMRWMHRAAR